MYYKSYSLWKQSCQADYTTQEVAEQGARIGGISRLYYALFVLTLITYIMIFVNQIFMVYANNGSEKCCNICFLFVLIGGLIETGGYIGLIAVYS